MYKKKRILFLNRSFYPDVEATGQLLAELCEELSRDFEVHVLCGKPLYRKVRTKGLLHKSSYKNITVWRTQNTTLPKNFFPLRLVNLFSYFLFSFGTLFFLQRMDGVISETDPPLLASLAYTYSRLHRCPFIYYSQDIWPQVGEATGKFSYPFLTRILKKVNGFLYRKADRVVVPGRDMKEVLEKENGVSSYKIDVVENWADLEAIYPVKRENNPFIRKHSLEDRFVVMYSGNIGYSQDWGILLETARSLKEKEEMVFLFIGEGASKKELTNLCSSWGLENVQFLTYQEKNQLKYSLSAAQVHLIPLKKGMKGTMVPSKVYGIMAAGRPFIASVEKGSEIDRIIQEFGCGIRVNPASPQELKAALLWAFQHPQEIENMGLRGKDAVEKHFSRKICGEKFQTTLKKLI